LSDDETYYNKSDSSNNNNDKNTYYNKLLNKSKSYLIKSFSFPNVPEVHELFEVIEKLAAREGASKSQIFLKALIEYVNRHCVPNPQLTLDRSLSLGLPAKPSNICCVPECKRKAKYILRLSNYNGKVESFPVCEAHREWRHKDYRFLVAFGELK